MGKNGLGSNNNHHYLLCTYYVLCPTKSFIGITSLILTELNIIAYLILTERETKAQGH